MDLDNSRKVVDISIDDILPNRYQPRIKFEDDSIFELAESIKVHGVFQPILVRPISDKYEIIAGERRYKASVLAGRTTIPAIIMNLNDKDAIEIALIENVQRSSLTPIEEAVSYKRILDMGYIKQEDLARKLGKTQSTIANKLRLLNLDEEVQEALQANKISERHARSLLRLKNVRMQKIMLKRIINERLTVRKADEEIDKIIKENENRPVTPIVIEDKFDDPTYASAKKEDEKMFNDDMIPTPNEVPSSIDNTTVSNLDVVTPIEEANKIEDTQSVFGFTDDSIKNINENVATPVNTLENDTTPSVESITTPEGTATSLEPETIIPEPKSIEEVVPASVTPVAVESIEPTVDFGFNNNTINTPNVQSVNQSTVISSTPMEEVTNIDVANADIDKIEEQAAPLYQDAPVYEKPELLKPEVVPAKEEVEIETPPVFSGKFFNFEPVVQEEEEQKVNTGESFQFNNFVETENNIQNDATSAPSFDDFFKNQTTTTLEAKEETPIPTQYDNFSDTAAEAISNDTLVVPSEEKNVSKAVDVIKEAIDKLKSLGYNVEVDELDLESIYQLIIKIDK